MVVVGQLHVQAHGVRSCVPVGVTTLCSMSDQDPPISRALSPNAGLCESCKYRRLVPNTRGSVFSLCERSRTDPAYPRYPRLPVMRCAGYEQREADVAP